MDYRCPRIVCEMWTPGNRQSPDGPSRAMNRRCLYIVGHRGRHWYGKAHEVKR